MNKLTRNDKIHPIYFITVYIVPPLLSIAFSGLINGYATLRYMRIYGNFSILINCIYIAISLYLLLEFCIQYFLIYRYKSFYKILLEVIFGPIGISIFLIILYDYYSEYYNINKIKYIITSFLLLFISYFFITIKILKIIRKYSE
jgi:hypothetical protein